MITLLVVDYQVKNKRYLVPDNILKLFHYNLWNLFMSFKWPTLTLKQGAAVLIVVTCAHPVNLKHLMLLVCKIMGLRQESAYSENLFKTYSSWENKPEVDLKWSLLINGRSYCCLIIDRMATIAQKQVTAMRHYIKIYRQLIEHSRGVKVTVVEYWT